MTVADKPVQAASSLKCDVLIVGGGLAGLSLAIALGQAGLGVAVIDREDPARALAAGFDGRVSAIADASVRMLEAIGLWRHVVEAQPILDIRVSDGDSPFFVHYDHHAVGNRPFGQMVENRAIRQAQQARLAELPNVTLFAPAQATAIDRGPYRVGARLADGTAIEAPLCVAADGKASPLRQQAGIGTVGWDYGQDGIVCTVEHERPHGGVAQERFLQPGPFAILPMTGNRSSLVWTEPREVAGALLRLEQGRFDAELARRFGDHFGVVRSVGPRWSYPLTLQLADRYAAERLVLVGDAAHGIHPIAGQGLNLGLRDVAALAEILVDTLRLGLDLGGGEVASRYERWRRFDTIALAAITDGLNRLFLTEIAPVRLVRDLGLGAVNALPALKKVFMRHAMGSLGDVPRLLRGEAL
jgi:2-octaprenyl-6-methoxyphenol hydroxylase